METSIKLTSVNKQISEENNNVLPIIGESEANKAKNEEIDYILKNYMNNVLKNVTDNVCLYDEKTKTLKKKIEDNPDWDSQKKQEEFTKELSLIPLRLILIINFIRKMSFLGIF